jgi:hypothetical protein
VLTDKDLTKADIWRQAAAKRNVSGYASRDYRERIAVAYAKQASKDMDAIESRTRGCATA